MSAPPAPSNESLAPSATIEFSSDEHPTTRNAALDGLRAFAVGAVIVFHGGLPHAHGGFLGVDLFFALSGFLITSLLVSEFGQRSGIGLGRFYVRRARRLFPALAVVVIAVVVVANLHTPPGYYPGLRGDVLASLLYYANWHLIPAGHSYFTLLKPPTPLTHTWSLAIEEQYYILWPLIVLGMLKWRRNVLVVGALAGVGAMVSTLEMAYGYVHGWPINRLYYGTDTHLMGLALGSMTACAMYAVAQRDRTSDIANRTRRALLIAGPAGALLVVAVMAVATGTSSWMYKGGFTVVALGASALIAHLVISPGAPIARFLSLRPLVYIGTISYGLYLWHYPIFQWLTAYGTGLSMWPLFALRVALTSLAAVLSYHFIEYPIRHRTWPKSTATWVLAVSALIAVGATSIVGATLANDEPAVATPARVVPAHPIKVLALGDSVMATLAYLSSPWAGTYGIDLQSDAQIGCGLVPSNYAQSHDTVGKRVPECQISRTGQWADPAMWREAITTYHPDVVIVLAGRWEERNLLYGNTWKTIYSKSVQSLLRSSVTSITNDAKSVNAKTVFFTMPCAWDGERPSGAQWVENDPRRQSAYNRALSNYARAQGAYVYDLEPAVCPTGKVQYFFNGQMVRDADGTHFAAGVGPYLAGKLFTYIDSVASSSGAR